MEWISVEDRLPKEGQHVLCARNIKEIKKWWFGCCKYADYGFPWVSFNSPNPVEYWMSIPEPPSDLDEGE